jgi:hypothetical protein
MSLGIWLTDGGDVIYMRRLAAIFSPGKFLVPVSFRGRVDPKAAGRIWSIENPVISAMESAPFGF